MTRNRSLKNIIANTIGIGSVIVGTYLSLASASDAQRIQDIDCSKYISKNIHYASTAEPRWQTKVRECEETKEMMGDWANAGMLLGIGLAGAGIYTRKKLRNT